MTSRHTAPEQLVDAYLHDLERALTRLDVDERRDVVDSVREHIDAALEERGRTPTTGDVEDVLRQLGPVEHIARDADNDSPARSGDARNQDGTNERRRTSAATYLLAALIVGMAITASLVIIRIPPFFGPQGGDLVVVAQLTWVFIVFGAAALVIKRNSSK